MISKPPQLVAAGNVTPARAVRLANTADFTGVQASAATDTIIGFADQSTLPGSAFNATAGEPINLQTGPLFQVEAGAAITRGALLEIDAQGRVITQATVAGTITVGFQALENAAAAGDLIWIAVIPARVRFS